LVLVGVSTKTINPNKCYYSRTVKELVRKCNLQKHESTNTAVKHW